MAPACRHFLPPEDFCMFEVDVPADVQLSLDHSYSIADAFDATEMPEIVRVPVTQAGWVALEITSSLDRYQSSLDSVLSSTGSQIISMRRASWVPFGMRDKAFDWQRRRSSFSAKELWSRPLIIRRGTLVTIGKVVSVLTVEKVNAPSLNPSLNPSLFCVSRHPLASVGMLGGLRGRRGI